MKRYTLLQDHEMNGWIIKKGCEIEIKCWIPVNPDVLEEITEEDEIEELNWNHENSKLPFGDEMLISDTDEVISSKINELVRAVNALKAKEGR